VLFVVCLLAQFKEQMDEVSIESFHPNAMAMLKSSSLNKMVKGFVRSKAVNGSRNSVLSAITLSQTSSVPNLNSNKGSIATSPPLSRSSTRSKFTQNSEKQEEQNSPNRLTRQDSYKSIRSHESDRSPPKSDTIYNALPYVPQPSFASTHESGVLSSSRKLESRELASERTKLGGVPLSPAQMDVNGFLIPRKAMQDSMVTLVRQKETDHRKTHFAIGEEAFDDSIAGSFQTPPAMTGDKKSKTNNNNQDNLKNNYKESFEFLYRDITNQFRNKSPEKRQEVQEKELQHPSVSLINSNTDNSTEGFLKLTSKSKVNSLVRIEDDYAVKWQKMKEKRDQEYQIEEKLEKRKDLRHLICRIAMNSDR
jgi:hypothetical protein